MNLDFLAVVMALGGSVLIYSAVKNQDPRDVVRIGLGAKIEPRPIYKGGPEQGFMRPITPTPGGGGGAPRALTLPPGTQLLSN